MAVEPMNCPVGIHTVGSGHSFGIPLVSINRSSQISRMSLSASTRPFQLPAELRKASSSVSSAMRMTVIRTSFPSGRSVLSRGSNTPFHSSSYCSAHFDSSRQRTRREHSCKTSLLPLGSGVVSCLARFSSSSSHSSFSDSRCQHSGRRNRVWEPADSENHEVCAAPRAAGERAYSSRFEARFSRRRFGGPLGEGRCRRSRFYD